MRLGLFGGSFDPVHRGHLALAAAAHAGLGLDGVLFVPAYSPPHKPDRVLAPVNDRLAMLEAALRGHPAFTLSRIETDTAAPAYTIDTVHALQRLHGAGTAFVLLLGWDAWLDFPQWHQSDRLRTDVEIAVAPRPGADGGSIEGALRIPCDPLAISSSEVRARVAVGQDITALVPQPVAAYIDAHGLYRHG